MVEIKKHVTESYALKKPIFSFKINIYSTSQPLNTISNAESNQELEEDSPTKEEAETKEEVELN